MSSSFPHLSLSYTYETLGRGKACLVCRRRRTKCDGARPFCGQCIKAGRSTDCEYRDAQGRPHSEALEEYANSLQTRVWELEHPDTVTDSVILRHPYGPEAQAGGSAEEDSAFVALSRATDAVPRNVPQYIHEYLIRDYLANARGRTQGFIWFRDLFGLPLRSIERQSELPHSALLSAVFLLTILFSSSLELKGYKVAYLQLCEAELRESLPDTQISDGSNISQKTLQVIQAHVLLAQYHFTLDQGMQGRYYLNGAVALILVCGIIRVVETCSNTPLHAAYPSETVSYSNERIAILWTFWVVFTMDRCWSIANGSPCSLTGDNIAILIAPGLQSTEPTLSMMGNYEDRAESLVPLGSLAKASALLEHSEKLSTLYTSASGQHRIHIRDELQSLTQSIYVFLQSSPPLEQILFPQEVMKDRNAFLLLDPSANPEVLYFRVEQTLLAFNAVTNGTDVQAIDPIFRALGRKIANVIRKKREQSSRAERLRKERLDEIGGRTDELVLSMAYRTDL